MAESVEEDNIKSNIYFAPSKTKLAKDKDPTLTIQLLLEADFFTKVDLDDEIKKFFKIESEGSNGKFWYIIIGYELLAPQMPVISQFQSKEQMEQEEKEFNFYRLSRMKAFAPTQNFNYHKETKCSTTLFKRCIYETFFYLYIDDSKIISKNQEKIKEYLKNENANIQKDVSNGDLLFFLLKKAKEKNETMYVEFFKKDVVINHEKIEIDLIKSGTSLEEMKSKKGAYTRFIIKKAQESKEKMYDDYFKHDNIGFKVTPDGAVIKIEKYDELVGQKIFLYVDQHVGPRQNMVASIDKYIGGIIRKELFLERTFILSKEDAPTRDTVGDVIGFDFETYNDKECKANGFAVCLSNGKIIYGKDTINEFCNYIDEIATPTCTSKTNQKVIVKPITFFGFNNSRFDNLLFFNELLKRNPSMTYKIVNSSIKYMKYYNVRFCDMSLFYSGSLADVAEGFKLSIKKGVFPYTFPNGENLDYIGKVPEAKFWKSEKERKTYIDERKKNGKNENEFNLKEYCLEYCALDAQLVKEIADAHLKNCSGEINGITYNVRSAITGAGLSVRLFKQVFLGDLKLIGSPFDILKKERDGYKGGKTDLYRKMFITTGSKYLYYFDINSSYPYAMTFPMPFKFVKTITCKETQLFKTSVVNHYLYLAKVKYVGNNTHFIPNILVRSEKGDIIGLKETGYTLQWGIELGEAIENECEVYVKEINIYEAKCIFRDFANYMYNERLKCKKTNKSLANFFKLVMNSLYGKFGETAKLQSKLCRDSFEIMSIINNMQNAVYGFDSIGESVLIHYSTPFDEKRSIGNLVRFASYISSIARSNLSIFMRAVGHEHVYYCDTDSVFCDVLPPKEFLDQNTLGKWKIETKKIQLLNGTYVEVQAKIKEAVFLAPKAYYYNVCLDDEYKEFEEQGICMKAKGHKNTSLVKDHFIDAHENKKVVIGNDAMFFRGLIEVHIKPQQRELRGVYNKRVWFGNSSVPYDNYYDWYTNKYGKDVQIDEIVNIYNKYVNRHVKTL